jgi:hypothetical protein
MLGMTKMIEALLRDRQSAAAFIGGSSPSASSTLGGDIGRL